MAGIKQAAKNALDRSKPTTEKVGRVAKSAAGAAVKAGARAAAAVIAYEVVQGMKKADVKPAPARKSRGKKLVAAIAGAAALTAAGYAVSRAGAKKTTKTARRR
jgi:hypothetical protein